MLKRIVISVLDSGGYGGSEVFLKQLSEEFINKRIHCEFLSVRGGKVASYLNENKLVQKHLPYRMDLIGDWKGFVKYFLYYFDAKNRLDAILRKYGKGSVVIATGFSDKIILTPICLKYNIPIFWIEYAPVTTLISKFLGIPKILYKKQYNLAERVIVPTDITKNSLIYDLRVDESKLSVIPLGIKLLDSKQIESIKNDKVSFKESLGLNGKVVIGMISRLQEGKGQDDLIKACVSLKKNIPNLKILIVGEGGIQEKLKKLAHELTVDDVIEFIGFYPEEDKWKLYSVFDVFVFPTKWKLEGWGLVALESMMMGIPLVASRYGPVEDVVGNAGYLINPNPKELSRAIQFVVNNKHLSRQLILNGYLRVKNFNIIFCAENILNVINKNAI